MTKISIKINATPKQVAEMKRLEKLSYPASSKPELFSPLGKYLIDNFSKELSEALFNVHKNEKDISPQ